jgi:very-short-patch-repair endonuclease
VHRTRRTAEVHDVSFDYQKHQSHLPGLHRQELRVSFRAGELMSIESPAEPRAPSPPPERGRSASEARRVGVTASRFNRTVFKTIFARRLRRYSTDVEAKLWRKLRSAQVDGASFRRQHPAGPYILDFYSPTLRLAIELDGGQHGDGPHERRDQVRDRWLEKRGVTVMRFWNSDITQNFAGVLDSIAAKIAELRAAEMTPTPALARRPPPFRGRCTEFAGPLRHTQCRY